MRKLLFQILSICMCGVVMQAQTHTFCASDLPCTNTANNSFTGSNTFSGLVNFLGGGTLAASATNDLIDNHSIQNNMCWVDGVKHTTIDSCVTFFGAGQGRIIVPSNYAGANQTLFSNNVIVEDLRNTITLIGNNAGYNAEILWTATNGAGTTNRVYGTAAEVTATAGGDGTVGHGETVANFTAAERTGGTRPVWAMNTLVQVDSGQKTNAAIGFETDVNNNSGTDASITNNPSDQIMGHDDISGGLFKPLAAYVCRAGTPPTNSFQECYAANNYHTTGLILINGDSGSVAIEIVPPDNTSASAFLLRDNANTKNTVVIQNGGNILSTGIVGGAVLQAGCTNVSGTPGNCATVADSGINIFGSTYNSRTICASTGGSCAGAPDGSVTIAAAATTVTVSTTAVTANSQILITEDSSLGTRLSVTCNTTTGRTYTVTSRTAATSFVITSSAAPTTNPACLTYAIFN